jgi:hypothetical protein
MLALPGAAARAKGNEIVRGPAVAPAAARDLMRRRRLVNMGVHLSEAVPPLSGI